MVIVGLCGKTTTAICWEDSLIMFIDMVSPYERRISTPALSVKAEGVATTC